MKVPHHGSTANVQPEFVSAVTADVYLFSANGKDQNPDPPVLELIAREAKKGRKFTMAFTNGNMIYDADKKGNFGKIGQVPVNTLAQAIALFRLIRTSPSCATLATSAPSRRKIRPRAKPREPVMLGVSCA